MLFRSPRVVCVTVGPIDFWECPDLLPEGEAGNLVDEGGEARRRQIPMAALQRGRPADSAHDAAEIVCARGPEWAPRQPEFRTAYDDLPVKWSTTPESQAHQAEGWRRDAANEVREALEQFELAFAAAADDAQTRHMLVKIGRAHV